jgi:hypothetical protein
MIDNWSDETVNTTFNYFLPYLIAVVARKPKIIVGGNLGALCTYFQTA